MTFISRSSKFFIRCLISLLFQISWFSVNSQDIVLPSCNQNHHGKEIDVTLEEHYSNFNYTVRLEWKALKCYNSLGMKIISIDHYPIPSPTSFNGIVDDFFTLDGYLTTRDGIYSNFYSPDDYCINSVNKAKIEIKLCEPSCKGNTPCVTKCCNHRKVWDYNQYTCVDTDPKWSPYFYSNHYGNKPLNSSKIRPHFRYFELKCENATEDFYTRDLHRSMEAEEGSNSENITTEKTQFKLLEDGSVWYIGGDRRWKSFDEPFCIDGITNYGHDEQIEGSGLESEQVMFFCHTNKIDIKSHQSAMYMGSMYAASIFLLLTCIVYLLLWDKQNVHGWTVFSLVLSMFFMFIFVATAHLYGLFPAVAKTNLREGPLCWLNGVLAHFFFLSTFFWLSTINFDLWLTFRSLTAVTNRSRGLKKFGTYAAISWGLPCIVISTGLILQSVYPNTDSLVIVPDYGKLSCFLAPWAQGVYLYYIISVLLILNLIFMGYTFFSLYQVKKVTGTIRSNKADNQNETFLLVAKLSVVMGVTWIFEVISWMLTRDYSNVAWYFVIFDVWNFFQAVLIFIIFTCKKSIKSQLEQKYPVCKKIFTPIANIISRPSGSDSENTQLTSSTAPKTNIPMKGTDNSRVYSESEDENKTNKG